MAKQDYTTVRVSKDTMRQIERLVAYLTIQHGEKQDAGTAVSLAVSTAINQIEKAAKQ